MRIGQHMLTVNGYMALRYSGVVALKSLIWLLARQRRDRTSPIGIAFSTRLGEFRNFLDEELTKIRNEAWAPLQV